VSKVTFFLGLALSVVAGVAAAFLFFKAVPLLPVDNHSPLLSTLGVRKPVVIGFVPYWLITNLESASLNSLDTVTYFSLSISEDGTLLRKTNPQESEPGWRALELGKFSGVVKDKPSSELQRSLLVHLSDEDTITALLSNPTQHATAMLNDAEPLMKQYEFTDLNIDIESFRVASPSSQAAMTAFLKAVKQGLVERQLGTLTVELAAGSLIREYVLKPEDVGQVADYVVIMAYDYYYSGSPITGPVAPLSGAKDKWQFDVTEAVKQATLAIPPEKIILGIPTYGYEWETLTDQPQSPVIPGTNKTATTRRTADIIKNCPNCVIGRDPSGGSPYLILPPTEESAFQQIYYEDKESIRQKLELAKAYKLRGVAIWALGYENSDLLEPIKDYRKTSIELD
jgi:spore germination protein YaaH